MWGTDSKLRMNRKSMPAYDATSAAPSRKSIWNSSKKEPQNYKQESTYIKKKKGEAVGKQLQKQSDTRFKRSLQIDETSFKSAAAH